MDESILATYLDGYESKAPIGERTHRASIVILSSLIERVVAEPLSKALRGLYHTHRVELAAGSLTLFRGLEALFPHETDYLALRIADGVASLILVRKGVMLAAPDFGLGSDLPAALYGAFSELARTQPLPRSIFVVASDGRQEELKAALADPRFAPLWLSDVPPRVLPVRNEHLTIGGKVSLAGDVRPDLPLGLIALFCARA
jgi:hypothetical protein